MFAFMYVCIYVRSWALASNGTWYREKDMFVNQVEAGALV